MEHKDLIKTIDRNKNTLKTSTRKILLSFCFIRIDEELFACLNVRIISSCSTIDVQSSIFQRF